jgi:putative oxidoreductase
MGFPPYFAYIAGIIEFFGGCLLIAGLFTRAAGLLLAGMMAVAIWKVHLGKGILAVGEYEFPLALAVGAFALSTTGAGLVSLDYLVFKPKAKK